VNATSRELAFVGAARHICGDDSISFVIDDYKSQARFLFQPLAECKKIGLAVGYVNESPADEALDLKTVNGTSYVFGAGPARDKRLASFIDLAVSVGFSIPMRCTSIARRRHRSRPATKASSTPLSLSCWS
jgi:hypothetical protein